MENKILVAYASKHGATAEIAEKIGKVINQAGLQVEVIPVKNIKDLKQYRAVILGTAAYMFKWRPEAVLFLRKNEKLLAQTPIWIFSSGPLGKGNPVELLKGQRYPKALQPVIDRIKPRDVTVFHGNINMQKLNLFEKFVFNKTPDMQGDFRDWDAISSWAKSVAETLIKQQ